ncbi:hypothetical protein R3P38DRAFT_1065009 [Favolaschia claudopus]|uniref:Taste receptor type 2 n=1 Tax=Favolaschia claudopus TaxID=2862362 RepID=A0AAW0BG61_9AGAR
MSDMQLDVELSLRQLTIFNSLFILGLILLVGVILPPIFSPNVRRSPLWFTFMGSWLLYCVSCLLLIGNQLGPDPPFGLCLFQAALIHSMPSLATICGVCFIVDVYCIMRISLLHSYWIPMRRTLPLLAFPVVSFIFLFFLSVGIGLQDHSTVGRVQNMFCRINTGLPTLLSAILSAFALLVAIAVDVAAVVLLYRVTPPSTSEKSPDTKPPIARGMLIRIFIFSLLTLFGLGLNASVFFHYSDTDVRGNMLIALLPILMAVLFGAQRDILTGWWFWRRIAHPEGAV